MINISNVAVHNLREYGLVALVLAALAFPLLVIDYPPLVDAPNHIARIWFAAHYDEPEVQALFLRCAKPIPNMAIDAVGMPLMWALGPERTSRVVLAATVVVFGVGWYALARTILGRPSARGILGMTAAYNSTLLYGFLNYSWGLGLVFVALALWWRWMAKPSLARLALATVAFTVAFFAHLSSLAIGGLVVTGVSLARAGSGRDIRTLARGLCVFVPIFPLFILYKPPSL